MKECSKCKITKSVDNFYKHNRYGYQYICKDCNRIDYRERSRIRRHKNPEEFKAKNKKYYLRHSVKKKEYIRQYTKNNPEKKMARDIVRSALKKGILIKELCFCGKKSEGHHPDYVKPLEVIWLCKSHHREAHGSMK